MLSELHELVLDSHWRGWEESADDGQRML